MNDYFWLGEPEVMQERGPYGVGTIFCVKAMRNDGEWFMTAASVTNLGVMFLRSKEQESEMLAEVMKQLARGMESFLDPECICRVGQTEECPVRHPRKN